MAGYDCRGMREGVGCNRLNFGDDLMDVKLNELRMPGRGRIRQFYLMSEVCLKYKRGKM